MYGARCVFGFLVIGAINWSPANAMDDPPIDLGLRVQIQTSVDRALTYLASTQGDQGSWEAFGQPHPAITALVVKALAQDNNYGAQHPVTKRGVEFIRKFIQPDGGVYVPGEGMRNYHTSVCLLALAATKDSAHAETIRRAQQFLKKLQWDVGEGHEASSAFYGGQGYGKHKRPDLSNTQLMLEALHQSGLSTDDPVYRKALIFVSRCQMLDASNDQSFADESVDGGFVYSPVGVGESKAGTEVVDGHARLRSYGSMTYAGFKSLLYAQVDRDDIRVQRAIAWIRRHYTLNRNPNMPDEQSKQGLYYYYHVFARAMRAWGEDIVEDADGLPHNWRVELCEKLLSLQKRDGSWVNEADRWFEGNPHLVTAYAVLTLQTALER